jgi:hypothetical protein
MLLLQALIDLGARDDPCRSAIVRQFLVYLSPPSMGSDALYVWLEPSQRNSAEQ